VWRRRHRRVGKKKGRALYIDRIGRGRRAVSE